ncbi:AAA family ATPase [Pseudomonas citronellolis]|uniref:histidine kinase n=1 Tax=Pseudomonas citronellolis TaxID=53408 RepID=A0AAW6P929_9PSED|nr:trifunctional serine/threonine-protein kinase/ATP-binding protein/sensor histidine kinase [Pseudomonas citronellolis]MDF3844003.1 AAA family ATPase [Pseudomonas citronellolis]
MSDRRQVLWDDGERVFSRGRHPRQEGLGVLLARPAGEPPQPASVERLAHEFGLKDELDGTWAVRPLELLCEGGRSLLVLEDPGGKPLSAQLGAPMETGRFLQLAVGISAALGHLHQRGLVHKDLKPPHILVDCADGRVRLTGFGLASWLPRERQAPEPPETIAGTLAYMAPEQTGRMNRSIDSRSDLYALGITLYQMLTGDLPFAASEAMEWVHCHIARQAVPPTARVASIPAPLSQLVMKLLAKTAEERYQSAAGLEHDLRRCLASWQRHGRIDDFPLDGHSVPERLLIPEKLYGREREVGTLVAAFERIVAGDAPGLVLVSGYSGIGKSSVVNELHKLLVPPRGLFASGKFDQYKRNIPYSTLVQAFQGLVRMLLGKNDRELARWRQALQQALGANARVMTELIPELKLIIGEPPPLPALEPQQAQRRFLLVLKRFIGVFARPEHPLALFLDDLQWLDAATLDLLEDLLTSDDLRHLMLLGAYRSNEVDDAHPLRTTLRKVGKAQVRIDEIRLAPLGRGHVEQLIAEALHGAPAHIRPLAQLVHDKTAGNPFFVIQFLQALAEEGLLAFEAQARQWRWDLGRIQAMGYTDNVVDLMLDKLARLPAQTQEVLQQLACLGNRAEAATLGSVLALSRSQLQRALWDAIRQELVERGEGAYAFAHDRIHEAAYLLIPQAERAAAHLRIGRLLAEQTPPQAREEAIFEIVGQLNRGAALIAEPAERERLAGFNLLAGQRAKASTAYASALAYFARGAELLDEASWQGRHELLFALESGRAECEFATGQVAQAEQRLRMLSGRAATTVQRAWVACLQVDVCLILDRRDDAVAVCLDFLRHVGIDWPAHPDDATVQAEYERIRAQLGARPIDTLIDLPPMREPLALATIEALTTLFSPALHTDGNLACLTICKAINLSLEHGNGDASCVAYANIPRVAGRRFGDYQAGFQFGRLGCELVERRRLERYEARTYLSFSLFAQRWVQPVRACEEQLRRVFDSANRTGDLPFGAFACNSLVSNLLFSGEPLPELQAEAERGLAYAGKVGFGLVIDFLDNQLALIRTLRGLAPRFGHLDQGAFREAETEARLADASRVYSCWYWIRKLQARYFAGDYAAALEASAQAQPLLWTSHAFIEEGEYCFFDALAHAALCDAASPDDGHLDAIAAHRDELRAWADLCPANFSCHVLLLEAELARLQRRVADAELHYEQAIRAAQDDGFLQVEALANELAAACYAARGLDRVARVYLQGAHACYRRWGAEGKLRQLEARHPFLGEQVPAPGPIATMAAPVEQLDLATVLKVLQTTSGEIVLERLVDSVMRTALEQAGAERGVLVLQGADGPRIVAQVTVDDDAPRLQLRDEPLSEALLPEALLYQVLRTGESLALDDALAEAAFATSPYVRNRQARSILCLPLMNQGQLSGALYLENNLTARAFSPARTAVLKLVASQAAASLENARLYRDLAERERRYREVQGELAHANRVATMGQLTASIAHEVNQPIAATITNAYAAQRWLGAQPPDLGEVGQGLERIVKDANRAADVLKRIRGLLRKAPSQKSAVDINEAILEMVEFTRGQAAKGGATVRTQLADGLPPVEGDRVELQQVLLNLIINAIEAMGEVDDGVRRLDIETAPDGAGGVRVSVSDTGPGFAAQDAGQVFAPFYTTKPSGLGMGLSICRSIIEAHGGQLQALANPPRGALVRFDLRGCPGQALELR